MAILYINNKRNNIDNDIVEAIKKEAQKEFVEKYHRIKCPMCQKSFLIHGSNLTDL